MAIDMQPVSSSQIESMGHDPESNTMRVKFASGAEYEYSDVPAETFQSVVSSDSVGAAFNSTIKSGGYSYSRV